MKAKLVGKSRELKKWAPPACTERSWPTARCPTFISTTARLRQRQHSPGHGHEQDSQGLYRQIPDMQVFSRLICRLGLPRLPSIHVDSSSGRRKDMSITQIARSARYALNTSISSGMNSSGWAFRRMDAPYLTMDPATSRGPPPFSRFFASETCSREEAGTLVPRPNRPGRSGNHLQGQNIAFDLCEISAPHGSSGSHPV